MFRVRNICGVAMPCTAGGSEPDSDRQAATGYVPYWIIRIASMGAVFEG
jgi:hypothetical protein